MKVAAHPRAARTVAVHPRAARTVATSSRAALVPQPHRATHPREARDAPASPSHSTEGGSGRMPQPHRATQPRGVTDASASSSHSSEGGPGRSPPRETMDASASPCPSRTPREATEDSASPLPHCTRGGSRCLTLPQPGGKGSLIIKSSPSSRTSPWEGR